MKELQRKFNDLSRAISGLIFILTSYGVKVAKNFRTTEERKYLELDGVLLDIEDELGKLEEEWDDLSDALLYRDEETLKETLFNPTWVENTIKRLDNMKRMLSSLDETISNDEDFKLLLETGVAEASADLLSQKATKSEEKTEPDRMAEQYNYSFEEYFVNEIYNPFMEILSNLRSLESSVEEKRLEETEEIETLVWRKFKNLSHLLKTLKVVR